jgi:hypothetical protein
MTHFCMKQNLVCPLVDDRRCRPPVCPRRTQQRRRPHRDEKLCDSRELSRRHLSSLLSPIRHPAIHLNHPRHGSISVASLSQYCPFRAPSRIYDSCVSSASLDYTNFDATRSPSILFHSVTWCSRDRCSVSHVLRLSSEVKTYPIKTILLFQVRKWIL